MKAYVIRAFGPPARLQLAEIDTPVPTGDQVLVRIRATTVNPYDWHNMRGEPRIARLMGGLRPSKSKVTILGADVAGEVEAVGPRVTDFRPGDRVFALLREGGFADYACVSQSELAPMPKNLSYQQAACVPLAGVTALLSLRLGGDFHRVLVNGASGGVGTFAVQIARAYGAKVTGVCGPRNVEMVRSIGATEVIDYSKSDFTRTGQRFDLVLDIAGNRPMLAVRRVLTRKGTYVAVGGPGGRWLQPVGHIFGALAVAPLVSQRVVLADVVRNWESRRNLTELTKLIEAGQLTPVIDREYAFADLRAAVEYQEKGHASGKVVVTNSVA